MAADAPDSTTPEPYTGMTATTATLDEAHTTTAAGTSETLQARLTAERIEAEAIRAKEHHESIQIVKAKLLDEVPLERLIANDCRLPSFGVALVRNYAGLIAGYLAWSLTRRIVSVSDLYGYVILREPMDRVAIADVVANAVRGNFGSDVSFEPAQSANLGERGLRDAALILSGSGDRSCPVGHESVAHYMNLGAFARSATNTSNRATFSVRLLHHAIRIRHNVDTVRYLVSLGSLRAQPSAFETGTYNNPAGFGDMHRLAHREGAAGTARAYMKYLGNLVREAIRLNDSDELIDAMKDAEVGCHSFVHEDRAYTTWSHTEGNAAGRVRLESMRSMHDRVLDLLADKNVPCDYERARCGHIEYSDEIVTPNGRSSDTYCGSCADDHLVRVDGEWYHPDDAYYWESDDEYHLEPEPTRETSDSSDELMSWGTDVDHYVRHDHSLSITPFSDFIMGVELEVESDGDDLDGDIVGTRESLNGNDPIGPYAVLKRDGSLGEYGFEIVTAARRLDNHLQKFSAWYPVAGLTSWNAGHCGMHVHIDSRAFSALTLGKFMMFINKSSNKDLIRDIAGRHPHVDGNAADYCQSISDAHLNLPSNATKTSSNSSRYRMVNLCNLRHEEMNRLQVEEVDRESKGSYSTVELRIFRGTLRKSRLLAQLEFAHAAVMFCRVASWNRLDGMAFKEWLTTCAGRYKNLARWYKIVEPRADTRPGAPHRVVSTYEV